ncbi:MAG: ATP-binding protein [Alphaproteobacteria bacterium]|nr:ATP-binding protein [Alphaproteobacteria bacterium]
MNIKDRQIILRYLRNMVNSESEPEDMDYFIKKLSQYSSDLFGFCLRDVLNSSEKLASDDNKAVFVMNLLDGKLWRNVLSSEDNLHQRVSKIFDARKDDYKVDITKPDFDKNFTMICDTFDLPDNCRRLLQFLVCVKNNIMLRRLLWCYNDDIDRDSFLNENNSDFIATVCKMSEQEIREAFAQNGPLFESGILKNRYGDNEFNKTFLGLLTMNFHSCKEVRDVLVGSPLTTTLKRENFDYIADDFDKVSDILINGINTNSKGINILLYGLPGTGKTEIAKTICNRVGLNLYTTSEKQQDKDGRLSNMAQMQTVLKNEEKSVILFDEAEDVFSLFPFSRHSPSKLYINRVLENNKRPVIWITNNLEDMDKAYVRRFSVALEVSNPDERAKINAWKRIFEKYELEIADEDIKTLVNKYQVPISMIETAVKNAKIVNNIDFVGYTLDHLTQAMTGKPARNKKPNGVKFDAKLLNTDIDLEKLANQISNKKLTNFSLCLYGAPGTGKTAFCEHLAKLLGINIIKKRASDINSKWVGETEQNIAKAFQEAHAQKAMLVFDEADSFLMDRTRAGHSWEISGVNEMLTQMEAAEYPFVCTTNLMDAVDKAALRRFSFKVKYDFLTQEQVIKAFKTFFKQTVSKDEVMNLVNLAPGDFVVVKKQADLLDITDKSELLSRLHQEQQVKNCREHKTKIGFHF